MLSIKRVTYPHAACSLSGFFKIEISLPIYFYFPPALVVIAWLYKAITYRRSIGEHLYVHMAIA